MKLKEFAASAVVVASGLLLAAPVLAQETAASLDARAKALHARLLVLDSHADILLPDTPARYRDKDGQSHHSLEKLQQGGVNAIVLALAVGPGSRDAAGVKEARAEVEAKFVQLNDFVSKSNGAATLVTSVAQLEAAHRTGRIAVIPGFLNARSLGKDLNSIDEFYRRGVRVFGLTHAGHNDWADSSRPSGGPLQEHGGLSALGKQAISRLNQLGVIVDVSQLTPAGLQQVLQLANAPVIASHSGVRALVENTRNLSDAELDAIGRNGGSVQIPAFSAYLHRIPPEALQSVRGIRAKYGLPAELAAGLSPNDGYPSLPEGKQGAFNQEITAAVGRASVRELVDQIDYVVKRIGIDHVGIGTDFDHGSGIEGFENAADAPNVTRELLRRGYTEEQIAKIWGGNFVRVFRAVEAKAVRKS